MKKWFLEDLNLRRQVVITILVIVLISLGIRDFVQDIQSSERLIDNLSFSWSIPLFGLILLGLLGFTWAILNLWAPAKVARVNLVAIRIRKNLGWLRWLIFAILAIFLSVILLYSPVGHKLVGTNFRLVFFLVEVIVMTFFATSDNEKLFRWNPLIISIISVGSGFVLAKEFLSVIDYPLSLTWSEGNRIWDYSMLYGRRLYDYPMDKRVEAFIDPVRQSLWGLPFLFSEVSITQVRFWSALVLTIPNILLGWMALRPLEGYKKQWFWIGIWVFLFLYQGPIYSPLVLSAILIASVPRKPIWIAIPLIYLAGYYAQLSRITWMVAPAAWAAMVALLDISKSDDKKLSLRDWLKTVLFGVTGFLGGFGIERGWRKLSRYFERISEVQSNQGVSELPGISQISPEVSDALNQTNSILTDQPFLWERLWPNPTYGVGIVFGLLLATVPLILLLIYLIKYKTWKVNLWQQLGASVILIAFLGIGIVVSVKIGGGGNLHNLDMFLVSLVFAAALAWKNGGKEFLARIEEQTIGVKALIFSLVLIPAFTPMVGATPQELPLDKHVQYSLGLIELETEHAISEGGEVLFIDQRQLLTFGNIRVPLVPEYEKKLLMDRALANDSVYFAEFYEDLANHRFSLIISDVQRIRYTDGEEDWAAENDAWVRWVTEPIFCYYTDKYSQDDTNIYVFVPREDVDECSFLD